MRLLPQLPRLAKQRPDLTLHLYVSFTADLLLRVRTREVDCAVLSARFSDPGLDAITLHREDYVFVASKALLARSPLTKPEHAAAHTLVDVSAELPLFRYWREEAAEAGAALRFGRVLRMGTVAAIEQLVLRGEGVAVLPKYLVQKRVEAGALRVVFPKVKPGFDHFRLVFRAADARRADYEALAKLLLEAPLR